MFGIKKIRRMAEELVGEPELVDGFANCFGVESAGMAQIRGNGCLALGRSTLAFVMLLPRKTLVIPRDAITHVEVVRSHLGKSKGVKLLKVVFDSETGSTDSVAWAVKDLDAWVAKLG